MVTASGRQEPLVKYAEAQPKKQLWQEEEGDEAQE